MAVVAAALGVLALLSAGCGGGTGSAARKSSTWWRRRPSSETSCANVGGEAVEVDQILQPNTDPHDYEPRPSDVEGAAGAKLVFANGDNLDSWVDQVVSDSGSDAEVIDLGAKVPIRLPGESSGAEASKYDPHWWHDPRNAEAAVREIERALAAADPSKRRRSSATPTPIWPN